MLNDVAFLSTLMCFVFMFQVLQYIPYPQFENYQKKKYN